MRKAISGHQRSSESRGGDSYQYSRRCSSFSPRAQRSSKPTRRYTHLMREAINMRSEMQSACNQHAISMQSRTPAHAPDDRPDRLMKKTISMALSKHSASTRQALGMHSACNQHALRMHSASTQQALSKHSACTHTHQMIPSSVCMYR